MAGIGNFEAVLGRSVVASFSYGEFRFLNLDALIASKKAAGRERDLAAVRCLIAIKEKRAAEQSPLTVARSLRTYRMMVELTWRFSPFFVHCLLAACNHRIRYEHETPVVSSLYLLSLLLASPCLQGRPENASPPAPGPGIFFVATNGNDQWSGTLPAPKRGWD